MALSLAEAKTNLQSRGFLDTFVDPTLDLFEEIEKLKKDMRRSAILFFMLFAMLWQSVALARVGSTVNVLADLEHAALHWQEEGHHHHDDGSYHLDDSNDSAQHVLSDHVTATTALLVTVSHDFPSLASAHMRPPCLDKMRCTVAKPIPLPSNWLLECKRLKMVNNFGAYFISNPSPLSFTK